jgi:hypothetical protein
MDRHDSAAIAQAIVALGNWETACKHNWALVPQTSEHPYLVMAVVERNEKSPVAARLMLFPGFTALRDFLLARRVADFGVGTSPMEYSRYELAAARDGRAELIVYEAGFVPRKPTQAETAFLAPLLYECYGVMLRLDADADLPRTYSKKNALFARKELSENVWIDGPLKVPDENADPYTEKVALDRAKCEKVRSLLFAPAEEWEVDFFAVPAYQTRDVPARCLYVLTAVDAKTGERMMWEKMSVDGKPDGLKRLWESVAQRMLDRFLARERVPGRLHVRSGRMMRFLRPLGLHVPFKLVQFQTLPMLEKTTRDVLQTGLI